MDHDIKITSEKSQRVQKLLSDNRVKELYSRNASAERTAPSSKNWFKSPDPFPSAFNHKASGTESKILESDEYNSENHKEIKGEIKSIGNQFDKNTGCDTEKDDLKIKILIEKSLADVEARLRKEFERKLQKNLEIYSHEESLRYQQANKAKEDLLNFIDPEAIIEKARKRAYGDLVSINNQSYEQFYNVYIKPLDEKFKNFDSKLKQFDITKNNIDPEAIIEEARKRAHDDLVSTIDQNYKQLYNLYQEIKSSSAIDLKILQESNQNTECKLAELENYLKPKIGMLNLKYDNLDSSFTSKLEQINQKFINIPSKQQIDETLAGLQTKIESWNKETEKKLKDWEALSSADKKFNKEKIDSFENKIQQLEHKKNAKITVEFDYSQIVPSNQPIISPQPKILPLNLVKDLLNDPEIQAEAPCISSQQEAPRLKADHSKAFSKSGLPNMWNTSYMNSLIQILASATEFAEFIKNCSSDKLLRSLTQVIQLIQSNSPEHQIRPHIKEIKDIIPEEYSIVNFNGFYKNDPKDLFIIISGKVGNPELFSIIKKQSFTCQFNHKEEKEDNQNFINIPENQQNDIESFLNWLKDWKKFSGQNQLHCANCGGMRDIVMKTESIQWPRILAIYMPSQLSQEIPSSLQVENNFYNLFGVICWYEKNFIAFTKNDENEWEKYNDSDVSKADPDWNRLYLHFIRKIINSILFRLNMIKLIDLKD
ncbi:unnamed protein product [Blepharisma stoltei]|uniref:USP domain-containing protein n=1 Tax=Blepharisma stoltei TaxID=1481888 RepID=A0AAU9IE40_9CILI|nr:unnamed protein product [Blepharisma stoltei]